MKQQNDKEVFIEDCFAGTLFSLLIGVKFSFHRCLTNVPLCLLCYRNTNDPLG